MNVLQGAGKCIIVIGSAVAGIVPVPGGDVYAKLDSVFLACFRELCQDVSLSVFPLALGNGMGAFRIGPEAEAVVVLGGNNYAFEPGSLCGCGPLAAVKVRRAEEVLRLLSAPPFLSAECVGAKVAEHVHFHLLPFQLRLCRTRFARATLHY